MNDKAQAGQTAFCKQHLALLSQCMVRNRHRLKQAVFRAKAPNDQAAVSQKIAKSVAVAKARASAVPAVMYPEALPISARSDELAELIKKHSVLVVAGETGSGKSTQLPKLCLAAGQGVFGQIAHTQPRRIATHSIANRLAQELGCELGKGVGYRVRFAEKCSEQDYIKVLTDGMLLAESEHDRFLNQYDTIIVDEAHERSLNIDVLLGYLKTLLQKRPDLKLIITSATIDTQRFSAHFSNAPIVTVSGRTYPVEVRYQPPEDEKERSDKATNQGILQAIESLYRQRVGNALVFLPGEREIREAMYFLGKHLKQGVEVLPLYARLPAKEQARLFKASSRTRIILSTNVAETSLTLLDIDYVVDTGYARISHYHPSRRVNALPIERISQAAANQRMGRCGRVKNGVCVRLFSEEEFSQMNEYTAPEIKRTSLAGVVLSLSARKLGDVAKFPFIDPPERRQINAAKQELQNLGAIDKEGKLSVIGKQLARMPVDPRIGRILWAAANEQDCLPQIIILASALEIADPRLVPFEKTEAARQHHREMGGEGSDFIALLSLWQTYQEQKQALSRNQLNRWCERNYLSVPRMREWGDLVRRLNSDLKFAKPKKPAEIKPVKPASPKAIKNQKMQQEDAIHKALLTGLIDQIALKTDKGQYEGALAKQCAIFPGSLLHKAAPKWIMAAELVETGRLYARTVAPINPLWVEELAPHLLRKEHAEPTWQAKAGQVMAFERAYLMSLPIYSGRRVPYAKINPAEARMLFIRDALVGNDMQRPPAFLQHNQQVIDDVIKMEHKLRRHDVLVAPDALYAFYHAKLPPEVCSEPTLIKWLRSLDKSQAAELLMSQQAVMRRELDIDLQARLPDALDIRGNRIDLSYQFKPGDSTDGITAKLPLPLLNQLTRADFDRVVPGYLADKLELLIRSLPKHLRKQCVPVADTVQKVQPKIEKDPQPLEQAMATALSAHTGVQIVAQDFDSQAVSENLRLKLEVVDEEGDTLDVGSDLDALQQQYGEQASEQLAEVQHSIVQSGKTKWDFPALPTSVSLQHKGVATTAYPALVDTVKTIGVQLFDDEQQAHQSHQHGLVRLFLLSHPYGQTLMKKPLPYWQSIALRYAAVGPAEPLRQDFIEALLIQSFIGEGSKVASHSIRDAQSFMQLADAIADQLPKQIEQHCELLQRVLTQANELRALLDEKQSQLTSAICEDITVQLDYLVYEGFLSEVPFNRLAWYPKFFKGVAVRIERSQFDAAGDQQKMQQLQPYWQRYLQHWEAHPDNEALEAYRWLVEVYRLSLFAQTVGSPAKVSPQRLDKAWQEFAQQLI